MDVNKVVYFIYSFTLPGELSISLNEGDNLPN